MINYINNDSISKQIFSLLSDQDKKFLHSTGEYKSDSNYLFSLIYKKKNKNIGFADIILMKKYNQPYIALAVLPQYRNNGIAQQLLQKAEKECTKSGYNILYYSVNTINNIPSINFAIKNNFIKDSQLFNFIIYKKNL